MENGPLTTIYLHDTAPNATLLQCGHQIPGFDSDQDGFLPGGFGWLNTGSEGCSSAPEKAHPPPHGTADFTFYYPGEGGAAPPQDCRDDIAAALDGEITVFIPYYGDLCRIGDDILDEEGNVIGRVTEADCPLQSPEFSCGSLAEPRDCAPLPDGVNAQSNNRYLIIGYGAFVLKTYRLPGLVHPDNNCFPGEFCLQGYFTRSVTFEGEFDDDKSMGIILVRLID